MIGTFLRICVDEELVRYEGVLFDIGFYILKLL